MLSKIVGVVSVLYFAYLAYYSVLSGGLYGVAAMLYYLPYLIAGLFLLTEEYKSVVILMGIALLFLTFYNEGYSLTLILRNLFDPFYVVFNLVLPALIVYCGIHDEY